ncbi:MAG: right-handed parallel beta-helix repeat-containing protein [Nitrospiraceae bacterium]|nr:right-handed parallel beta-helix repeat-containing protein [Nitrospiraceae bacterium]
MKFRHVVPLAIFLFLAAVAGPPAVKMVFAASYYVAPGGSDSARGTKARPWATFARAMAALRPGDTLYLKDGFYHQSLDVRVSGRPGRPIVFRAVNEGKAIVGTVYPSSPLRIAGQSYVLVEGINFRNRGPYDGNTYCSTDGAGYINVHGLNIFGADHIVLKRVTVNGSSGCNSAVIGLSKVRDSLIEDCAGSGPGRVVLNILDCGNITVRRCWLDWSGPSTGGGDTSSIAQIYDSSHVLMENNIGLNLTTTPTDDLGIWAHYKDSDHNTFVGNVVYHTQAYSAGGLRDTAEYEMRSSHSLFEDNVAILPVAGAYHSVPADVVGTGHHTSENNTYVGDGGGEGFLVHERPNRPQQATDAAVIDCSFINMDAGIYASSSGNNTVSAHRYNNFYRVRKCLWNERQMVPRGLDRTEKCNTVDPGYDTAKYGIGGYLIVPAALKGKGQGGADIGASVIYRYKNGMLTRVPLWPWPMEARILAEFHVSPTWQARGGIWKSLDGIYTQRAK